MPEWDQQGAGQLLHNDELFDEIPEAVLLFDDAGYIIAANAAAVELFGYTREEMKEHQVETLFQTSTGSPVPLPGRSIGFSQGPLSLSARHRDGGSTPVQLYLRHDSDSSTPYRLATVRPASEDIVRLAAIFEYSHDGIFVVDPDTELITDANPRACQMLGKARSELIGANVTVVHPEEMRELRAFFARVMEHGYGQTSELTCATVDNRRLDAEISASVADLGDKKNVVAIVRDVSERRELEHRVSRMATLPRDNPDPVVEFDLNGTVHYLNPRAQEEFPTLKEEGQSHPFCSGLESIVDELLRSGQRMTEREVEVNGATYSQKINVDATLDLCRIYAHDLTERKRTEELRRQLEVAETTKSATLDTIFRLSNAAEYRDEDTGAHIRRIAHYSAALGRRLEVDEETIEMLLYAAPMHDVGKIGIPDRVLLKPGRLTEEEMAIMRRHTELGAEILANSDSRLMQTAETIALTHHEKWDGTGYPRGLAGTDIPLCGRIVAVADVFDALISRRPYKEPFSQEKTLQIMKEQRGYHFCPEALDAFLDIQPELARIAAEHRDE
jgi:PAS domain S-box-containing protein